MTAVTGFVADKRFVAGALAGAFVVPWLLKMVSLRMASRTTAVKG